MIVFLFDENEDSIQGAKSIRIYNFLAHRGSPDYPRIQPIFPLGILLPAPECRLGSKNNLTMVRQRHVRQFNGHAFIPDLGSVYRLVYGRLDVNKPPSVTLFISLIVYPNYGLGFEDSGT